LLALTILVNGPLSEIIGRQPGFSDAGALAHVRDALVDPSRLNLALVFFVLSNFVFVFGIPFFAGLRMVAREADASGIAASVVGIGAAFFLGGGLLSEVFSTGPALAVLSAPAYHLDANQALFTEALWGAALSQAQVGLGVVVLAVCIASLAKVQVIPGWLAICGIVVGVIDIARPALVTHPLPFIATFVPTFAWIAALSLVLLRSTPGARRA